MTAQRDEWRAQKAKVKDWEDRNRKLYGLLLTAMPTWLRTSLYNSHSGNGLDALQYLRTTFDAGDGSGSDHAFHLKRIGESVIEPRREICEDDLRKQYDKQMTAKAAIIRTGKAAPDDATLIAMFDNALPQAYSTIRQLVRRSKHTTFLAHYSDYMELVRGELASRRPAPSAYGAIVFGGGGNDGGGGGGGGVGGGGGGGGGGGRKGVCLRCGDPSCPGRRKCAKPKTRCPLCGADHLPVFCPKATGNHRRDEIPSGALRLLEKEMAESLAKREKANAKTALDKAAVVTPGPSSYAAAAAVGTSPPPAAAPSTEAEERQRAFAAAAAVAAAESDPSNYAQVFEGALRSFGFAALHALNAIAPPLLRPPSVAGGAVWAFVDSMSTHFIVPDISMLRTVTNRSPGIGVDTANGFSRVEAIGTALIYLNHGGTVGWACYELPHVLVMPNCDAVLYSTRTMRDLFGFRHDFDSATPSITCPGRPGISITDDGAGFRIPLAFVLADRPQPSSIVRAVAIEPLPPVQRTLAPARLSPLCTIGARLPLP